MVGQISTSDSAASEQRAFIEEGKSMGMKICAELFK
jgi:hypothetical protein